MPLSRGKALLRAISRFIHEHPYIRGPDRRERLRVKRVALTGPERSAWATAYASGDEGVLFQVRSLALAPECADQQPLLHAGDVLEPRRI
jgi:hypothetical protein